MYNVYRLCAHACVCVSVWSMTQLTKESDDPETESSDGVDSINTPIDRPSVGMCTVVCLNVCSHKILIIHLQFDNVQ